MVASALESRRTGQEFVEQEVWRLKEALKAMQDLLLVLCSAPDLLHDLQVQLAGKSTKVAELQQENQWYHERYDEMCSELKQEKSFIRQELQRLESLGAAGQPASQVQQDPQSGEGGPRDAAKGGSGDGSRGQEVDERAQPEAAASEEASQGSSGSPQDLRPVQAAGEPVGQMDGSRSAALERQLEAVEEEINRKKEALEMLEVHERGGGAGPGAGPGGQTSSAGWLGLDEEKPRGAGAGRASPRGIAATTVADSQGSLQRSPAAANPEALRVTCSRVAVHEHKPSR